MPCILANLLPHNEEHNLKELWLQARKGAANLQALKLAGSGENL
ncbi:MAG: hypothetical protein ACR2PT_05695 [Endozoicomonas sp.]